MKTLISQKHPGYSIRTLNYEYALLDHQQGRCDYDPYSRYDVTWNEEIFGHLMSEDVPPSGLPDEELEEPVQEEEL